MNDSNDVKNNNVNNYTSTKEPVIIKTDIDSKNGQDKCPKCGATDISLNINNGHLRCNFCRFEFEPEKVEGFKTDIDNLEGQVFSTGTQDIASDSEDIVTFKCESCGSEVVIDTASSAQARCHWCRNTLSLNQQIPNGAVPDVVLPFKIKKEEAKESIEKFVGKRKFFAHPKFKEEFTTENIMGVYFPYMAVDINAHSTLEGQGEVLVRSYTKKVGKVERRYYDADLYDVERDFDIAIHGLTIESSSDKLDKDSNDKTTNVINAIMPFDVENAVRWNANYLKGYSSEKRDVNIEYLRPLVTTQAKDVSRFAANDSLDEYDRGVCWKTEKMDVIGEQWKAAYLPVWLYSYQEIKKNKKLLHYVAVNARTKETMGSIPINMSKLLLYSFLAEVLGFLGMISIEFEFNEIFLTSGVVYFLIMFFRYRNFSASHKHEVETKKEVTNLRKKDNFVKRRTGLSNSMISGVNNRNVDGRDGIAEQLFNQFTGNNDIENAKEDDN